MTIDTQLQAYAAIKPSVEYTQRQIINLLTSLIEYGATVDEMVESTGIAYATVQPRTNELMWAQKVFRKGSRRSKRSGALTKIYFLAITDEEKRLALKQALESERGVGDKKLWGVMRQAQYAYAAEQSQDNANELEFATLQWSLSEVHRIKQIKFSDKNASAE